MQKLPDKLTHYITTDWALGEKSHNDWSVLLPFGVDSVDNIWILPNIVRIKATPEKVVEALLDLMASLKPFQVGIESSHITKTIGPFLKRRMQERRIFTALWDGNPHKDKVARCASIRGRMQQGKVYFPDTPLVRETFIPELLQFPVGKHDDMVDCLAWAGIMLDTLVKAPKAAAPPPDKAPEWSKEWIQARIQKTGRDDRKHVPLTLSGRVREPKKRTPAWNH